jgi:hypothetical protein
MDNSSEPSDLIRARILDRLLPSHPDARIFTGAGDGQVCGCCDRVVGRHDLQIDVEHLAGNSNPVVAMHRACFQLWSRVADELSTELRGRSAQAQRAARAGRSGVT